LVNSYRRGSFGPLLTRVSGIFRSFRSRFGGEDIPLPWRLEEIFPRPLGKEEELLEAKTCFK
jgi:hypothetical protein